MSTRLADLLNVYNCCPSGNIAANEDIFNGDPASDILSLARYEEVLFVIVKSAGATGTATITVESCDDTTPTTSTAIAFAYKVSTSGNTWGNWADATSSGFVTTAGANQAYMVSVRAEGLNNSDNYVRLQATEVVDSACDGAILSIGLNPRYAKNVQMEMIT